MGLLNLFWTTKFVRVLTDWYHYRKDCDYVGDIVHSDDFKRVLSKYLFTNIKEDWIGRLYCVVNPNINEYGQFDISRVVIEFDDYTTHNDEYVKTFIYKQLSLVRDLFRLHNLYDYLNLDLKRVGPLSEDNFLVVISLVSLNKLLKDLNSLFKHTILYIVLFAVLYLYISN